MSHLIQKIEIRFPDFAVDQNSGKPTIQFVCTPTESIARSDISHLDPINYKHFLRCTVNVQLYYKIMKPNNGNGYNNLII